MEFRLTPTQAALRHEVRAWLAANVEPAIESFFYAEEEDPPALRAFNKKLAAKGWIAPAWPKEYGGMALGPVEQLIFSEEMSYSRAPSGGRGPAVGYAGPTIMLYGSGEQKVADALVLGDGRVRAGEHVHPVGVVAVARPDLRAVQDPVVAVAHRTGLERG